MLNWYDNDDLWELWYPFMFPPTHFEMAVGHVPQLEEMMGVTGGAQIAGPQGRSFVKGRVDSV